LVEEGKTGDLETDESDGLGRNLVLAIFPFVIIGAFANAEYAGAPVFAFNPETGIEILAKGTRITGRTFTGSLEAGSSVEAIDFKTRIKVLAVFTAVSGKAIALAILTNSSVQATEVIARIIVLAGRKSKDRQKEKPTPSHS
jgi:hypothetical protein